MTENIEKVEVVENSETSGIEELKETADLFMELSKEMEAAGNQDMAQYYAEKAKEFTADIEASKENCLGGWWAGYTASEWRDMAKEEYVKNGDSLKYKQYSDNAVKANG